MVSAVLIAALYFFSSYQHRFQLAQLTLDELARLANTDELTQLANRRRMIEVLEAERSRLARYDQPCSLILIDVDHFKRVNDRFGHQLRLHERCVARRCRCAARTGRPGVVRREGERAQSRRRAGLTL